MLIGNPYWIFEILTVSSLIFGDGSWYECGAQLDIISDNKLLYIPDHHHYERYLSHCDPFNERKLFVKQNGTATETDLSLATHKCVIIPMIVPL